MLRKTTRWPQAALETCEKELRSLNASQRCLYSADALRHSVSSIKLKTLKCGGTLAQRAERLFLLRGSSLEALDAKHKAPARRA